MTVVAETEPLADVSYGVSFADGRSYNLFGLGSAGPDGRWVFTFAVPADAAFGNGQVSVAAVNPEAGGGSGTGPFQVTENGACG